MHFGFLLAIFGDIFYDIRLWERSLRSRSQSFKSKFAGIITSFNFVGGGKNNNSDHSNNNENNNKNNNNNSNNNIKKNKKRKKRKTLQQRQKQLNVLPV